MNEINESLIEEITLALRHNDMDTRRFTAGGSMAVTYATRKALETVISRTPWHAVTWITYAMGYIAWQDALNASDKKALKDDLRAADARVVQLEQTNHELMEARDTLDSDLSALIEQLAALDAALDALKHQVGVRVEDRAVVAALQAQIALIQGMTGGVK